MARMDRLFDLVFVRSPPNSYINCVSTNAGKDNIDVKLAKDQHRQYVSILKESGVKVNELQASEDFPDSVFLQDPALLGSRRSVIGRFGVEARRGEEKVLVGELSEDRAEIGKTNYVAAPGTLEGGDIVVTDHGIFVGNSKRTNSVGIQQFSNFLENQKVRAINTDLLHLLCGCSYLNNRTMVIAPDLTSPESFPGFRFVTVPEEEAYAADALYLGEGRVLIPSGFPRTIIKLKETGYKPVEVEMSEFYKGDGGVTCLSSPVYKVF